MKAAAVLFGVAETLNFTAADEKLCLSQPTVSAQSAALEAELFRALSGQTGAGA